MRHAQPTALAAPARGARLPAPSVRDSTGRSRRAGAEPELIHALRHPAAYSHRVRAVRLVETHISWVLLTGALAYKIKKPVDFGFLDFSTLERRRAACEEELRLNRRWSPELYLDMVPITGTPAAPRLGGLGGARGGSGPPAAFEYAVRMRQFPQRAQLDRRLAVGLLTQAEVEAFASELGRIHAQAPIARPGGPFGSASAVRAPVEDSLATLRELGRGGREAKRVEAVRGWVRTHPGDDALRTRLWHGRVREVHGDLHLANLVRWQGRVRAFDCIEFDPALRCIDVLSDAAFLVMDLAYRGRRDLAYAFLNRYLETTGDYAGLAVLRYYLVYRALVRAKIAAIRRAAQPAGAAGRDSASVLAHLALARAWTQDARPGLVLMHGLSGSGKTRVSAALMTALPAVRLRSDLERARARPLAAALTSAPPAGRARYSAAALEANYALLLRLAEAVLAGGESVIVDATFLARHERERFAALAARLGVPRAIVSCQAPRRELERRVAARARAGSDASEADRAVLARQRETAEPLAADERACVVSLNTSRPADPEAVARAVRWRLGRAGKPGQKGGSA